MLPPVSELLDWTSTFSIASWGALLVIMVLLAWGHVEEEEHVIIALTVFASIALNSM